MDRVRLLKVNRTETAVSRIFLNLNAILDSQLPKCLPNSVSLRIRRLYASQYKSLIIDIANLKTFYFSDYSKDLNDMDADELAFTVGSWSCIITQVEHLNDIACRYLDCEDFFKFDSY